MVMYYIMYPKLYFLQYIFTSYCYLTLRPGKKIFVSHHRAHDCLLPHHILSCILIFPSFIRVFPGVFLLLCAVIVYFINAFRIIRSEKYTMRKKKLLRNFQAEPLKKVSYKKKSVQRIF